MNHGSQYQSQATLNLVKQDWNKLYAYVCIKNCWYVSIHVHMYETVSWCQLLATWLQFWNEPYACVCVCVTLGMFQVVFTCMKHCSFGISYWQAVCWCLSVELLEFLKSYVPVHNIVLPVNRQTFGKIMASSLTRIEESSTQQYSPKFTNSESTSHLGEGFQKYSQEDCLFPSLKRDQLQADPEYC